MDLKYRFHLKKNVHNCKWTPTPTCSIMVCSLRELCVLGKYSVVCSETKQQLRFVQDLREQSHWIPPNTSLQLWAGTRITPTLCSTIKKVPGVPAVEQKIIHNKQATLGNLRDNLGKVVSPIFCDYYSIWFIVALVFLISCSHNSLISCARHRLLGRIERD